MPRSPQRRICHSLSQPDGEVGPETSLRETYAKLAEQAAREQWTHTQYLADLVDQECQSRNQSRVQRLLRLANLPPGKTWDQFQWSRLPLQVTQQFETLRAGDFLDRRDKLLIFGRPGSGKIMLLAERYERGSVLLSSNQAFSKWEQIFKDPMTTAAAIDRLVHHSVIIELSKVKSYRLDEAELRNVPSSESKPGSKP